MFMDDTTPPLAAFTPAERRVIARLRTPLLVQRHLNRLPYNTETKGETFRSFRQVVRHGRAHCAEAALFAACVLEQHGYPPLLLTFESVDFLDHVLFVYRERGRWGTVARSRDPGLHGRKPVFRSLHALAMSYFDPYVDPTGAITGYALVDLRALGTYDWRFTPRRHAGGGALPGRHQAHAGQGSTRSASSACANATSPTARNTARSRCSIAAATSGRKSRRSFCSDIGPFRTADLVARHEISQGRNVRQGLGAMSLS